MKRFPRRLGMESLESRTLLAGNVVVSVNAGDLIITGDNRHNSILIEQVGEGRFSVSGRALASEPTTVNGRTAAFVVSGVSDDVMIDMGTGNDRVNIGVATRSTDIKDDLVIRGGSGVDTIIATRVRCDRADVILGTYLENSADTLIVRSCAVRGNASLAFGGGADRLELQNSIFWDQLKTTLGPGNDSGIMNVATVGSLQLEFGEGDDSALFDGTLRALRSVAVNGGLGTDTARFGAKAVINIDSSVSTLVNFELGNVKLSTGDAEPFASAVITGVLINPALPTIVTFIDPHGNQFSVSPTSVDSSGVRFPVPIFMDLTTGEVTSGVYSVRLKQQTSSGMVSYWTDKKLNVADLPSTDVAPGYVLNAFLTQMQTLYDDLLTDWQQISNQASPFTDLAVLTSAIQSAGEEIAGLHSQLSPLISGQVFGIELTPSVTTTQETLIDMDRVLLAQLTHGPSISSQSTLMAFSGATSASETVDQIVQQFFAGIQARDGSFEQQLPTLLEYKNVVVAGAAIAGAVTGGPGGFAAAATAVDLIGNASLMISGVGYRVGANMIRNGGTLTGDDLVDLVKYSTSLGGQIFFGSNFEEIIHIPADQAVTAWLKKAGQLDPKGNGPLAGAYTGVASIVSTLDDFVFPKIRELGQNFKQIVQNGLTPPVISVSTGSVTVNVPYKGFASYQPGFTVTNSGDPRSTLGITATSNLSAITISGGGTLSGGQSTSLFVGVNTSGLSKGTHIGSIFITSAAASNSPVEISVTINVLGAEIALRPYAMTLTVIQGREEQTKTFDVLSVGPTGSILSYTASTYGNYVQVVGNSGSLYGGDSDTLFVTSQASSLDVGTYTDYVFVVDSNEPNNYKYVTVTINVIAPPLPQIGGTTDVYFTATQGGPSPESQIVQISNVGASGSVLSWDAIFSSNRLSLSGGVSPLNANYLTEATLSINTSGLAAGSYQATITIYSTDDSRVADKTITVHITITGQSLPAWGAYESGANGRSSDQWYSISSAEMTIWFYAQPFGIPDWFKVTDESGRVYLDTEGYVSTNDSGFDVDIEDQRPILYIFTKPAGVTRLRVQVFANSDQNTGWWYYGRMPGQLWY